MTEEKIDKLLLNVTTMSQHLNNLSLSQNEIISKVDDCQKKIASFNTFLKQMDSLKKQNSNLSKQCELNENKIDNILQNSFKKSLNITNIPYKTDENIEHIIIKIFEVLECNMCIKDLDNYYRIIKRDKSASNMIRLEFIRFTDKAKFFAQTRVLRDKLNYLTLNFKKSEDDKNNKIFVNEVMSPKNRELFKSAKDYQKRGHFKYVWFKNGKIFTKKDNNPTNMITNKVQLTEQVTYQTDSSEFESGSEEKDNPNENNSETLREGKRKNISPPTAERLQSLTQSPPLTRAKKNKNKSERRNK